MGARHAGARSWGGGGSGAAGAGRSRCRPAPAVRLLGQGVQFRIAEGGHFRFVREAVFEYLIFPFVVVMRITAADVN